MAKKADKPLHAPMEVRGRATAHPQGKTDDQTSSGANREADEGAMTRRTAYAVLAVWTVGVAGISVYLLPSGLDASIGVGKIAFGVWVVGVAIFAGILACRDSEFFPH